MRTIDPETNWWWQQGHHDGIEGLRKILPDCTRWMFQRSDYYAGYNAGRDEREATENTSDNVVYLRDKNTITLK